jgi:hypothetical protein
MTLADVTFPIGYEWGCNHALLFTPALAGRLAQLHAEHGSQKCVPVPLALTDGRLMLTADILTECEPGGLLHAMWQAADKAVLLPSVDVVPIGEALALLPPSTPPA